MDPKLKEQIFIRKHRNSIITVIVMVLILPMLLIFPQTGTQYRQQAAEIVKTPNDSNPPLTTQPNINKAAGETQKDYKRSSGQASCKGNNRPPILSALENMG